MEEHVSEEEVGRRKNSVVAEDGKKHFVETEVPESELAEVGSSGDEPVEEEIMEKNTVQTDNVGKDTSAEKSWGTKSWIVECSSKAKTSDRRSKTGWTRSLSARQKLQSPFVSRIYHTPP